MAERLIINSMQNHIQKRAPYMAFMPIGTHLRLSSEAGYDGTEYYPFQGPSFQLRFTRPDTSQIFSSHESWGNGKAPYMFIMREKIRSLNDSLILQTKAKNKFLNVVYPHEPSRGEIKPLQFEKLQYKIIQPTVDLMKEWKVDNINDFLAKAKSMDFRICLDLFHIRRATRNENSTIKEDWKTIIDSVLNYTDEIHLSIGRDDFNGPFDSMAELVDIYTGSETKDIIPILKYIKTKEEALGHEIPIVTEVPADAIAKLLGKKNKVLTPCEISRAHRQIVNNLRSV